MLRIEAIADPHIPNAGANLYPKRAADRIVCGAGQADSQRADLSAVPLWLYRWNRAPADRYGAPFPPQREPDKEGGGRGQADATTNIQIEGAFAFDISQILLAIGFAATAIALLLIIRTIHKNRR